MTAGQDRDNKSREGKRDLSWLKTVTEGSQKYLSILVTPVILGGVFGFWLDKKFNTEPWLFTTCVFSGFVISIVILIRSINK